MEEEEEEEEEQAALEAARGEPRRPLVCWESKKRHIGSEQSEAAELGKSQAMQGLGGTEMGFSSKTIEADATERFKQSLTR